MLLCVPPGWPVPRPPTGRRWTPAVIIILLRLAVFAGVLAFARHIMDDRYDATAVAIVVSAVVYAAEKAATRLTGDDLVRRILIGEDGGNAPA